MNNDPSVCQEKRTRLKHLAEELRAASEEMDFDRVARLKNQMLQLEDELRLDVDQKVGAAEQEQDRSSEPPQDPVVASMERDYDKAAQLVEHELKQESWESTAQERDERVASEQHSTELPAQSPEAEIDFEISRRNFVRAVMLMEQCRYPAEQVRHFQERALRQYAFEYRNPQGLQWLIQSYGFSESDVRRVMEEGHSE